MDGRSDRSLSLSLSLSRFIGGRAGERAVVPMDAERSVCPVFREQGRVARSLTVVDVVIVDVIASIAVVFV